MITIHDIPLFAHCPCAYLNPLVASIHSFSRPSVFVFALVSFLLASPTACCINAKTASPCCTSSSSFLPFVLRSSFCHLSSCFPLFFPPSVLPSHIILLFFFLLSSCPPSPPPLPHMPPASRADLANTNTAEGWEVWGGGSAQAGAGASTIPHRQPHTQSI